MKNILIIEDDNVMQFLMRNLLVEAGYNVKSIMDGAGIASNISLLKSDLIILDMMIPNIYDSAKLIQMYRENNTPIIVISSIDEEDGLYFTKKIKAQTFINKPFDPTVLLREVNSILNENEKLVNVN